MVQFGMVQFGMVLFGMVLFGMVPVAAVRYDRPRNGGHVSGSTAAARSAGTAAARRTRGTEPAVDQQRHRSSAAYERLR
jgi:hypothetical protein